MASGPESKITIVERFQRGVSDTGSPEVQVALLTSRISYLTEHLKTHKKDFHSRRGLISMVNRRRKLLAYLKQANQSQYLRLIQDLSLRG